MTKSYDYYFMNHEEHDSSMDLHRIDEVSTKCRIDLSSSSNGHLCGRHVELEMYHKALQRVLFSSDSELILISGRSGAGKTALAKTLQQPITLNGGCFITGKCDQMQTDEPYTAIVTAFTEFVHLTLTKGDDVVSKMRDDIIRIAGSDIRLLVDMIPAFKEIVGNSDTCSCVLKGEQAQNRLKTIFLTLTRQICSVEHPLVLLMDDLQWADLGSLEILNLLLCSDKIQGLVIIGVCRDNEVAFDHHFAAMLRHLEDSKQTTITHIEVKNLSIDATNDLISRELQISNDVCKPLTKIIYGKTKGNAFFTQQLLEAVQDDGILMTLPGGKIWWDDTLLKSFGADIDVAIDLIALKIQRLPKDAQRILTHAACFGAKINENILSKIFHDVDVKKGLSIALNETLIFYEELNNIYTFSHDRVQQAVYDIIPSNERAATHLTLGRLLLQHLTAEEVTSNIFAIMNQFRLGKRNITNQNEMDSISVLCLKAGKKAILSSDFKTATMYLWLGIDFLGQRGWKNQYQLNLYLHNLVAETEYCSGGFEKMDTAVNAIFLNALNFSDKVWASTTLVYAFFARSMFQRALDSGLDLLKRLGESFPKHSLLNIYVDMLKTKRLLKGKTDEQLLNHPNIENNMKVGAMGVLNLLIVYSYHGKQELFPYIANRMMQISMKYGFCAISAVAFAAYGGCCCKLGNHEDGDRFGNLALRILGRYGKAGSQWIPRVYTIVYGYISVLKNPMRTSLDKLLKAHQVGIETGDMEFAVTSVRCYLVRAMLSGITLFDIEKRIASCQDIMDQHKQSTYNTGNALQLQFIHNLTGRSDDPTVLRGKALSDSDGMLIIAIDSGNRINYFFYYLYSTILAYHFGAIELGYKYSKELSQKYISKLHPCLPTFYFYQGMLALGMARKHETKKKKYIRLGKRAMKRLQKLQLCPSNSKHMIILLQAEILSIKSNTDLAQIKFNEAFREAGEEGYIQYQAIACECAGSMLKRKSCNVEGNEYIKTAIYFYDTWGATAKVDKLIDENKDFSNNAVNDSKAVSGDNMPLNSFALLRLPTFEGSKAA